jgi:hypothetical protein
VLAYMLLADSLYDNYWQLFVVLLRLTSSLTLIVQLQSVYCNENADALSGLCVPNVTESDCVR